MSKIAQIRMPCGRCAPSAPCSPRDVRYPFALTVQLRHFRVVTPNREARSEALYGAWLCGLCLGAVGMALHHKLCHTLGGTFGLPHAETRSEEHTSELLSLMRISYAVFCLKKQIQEN